MQIKNITLFRVVAAIGVLAMVAGSFGAHGIKFADEKLHKLYDTGLLYLFVHLPVIMLLSVLGKSKPALLMLSGILMFSVPLLTKGMGVFDGGIIVPIGGMLMILSWIWLIFIEKGETSDK